MQKGGWKIWFDLQCMKLLKQVFTAGSGVYRPRIWSFLMSSSRAGGKAPTESTWAPGAILKIEVFDMIVISFMKYYIAFIYEIFVKRRKGLGCLVFSQEQSIAVPVEF